MPSGPARQSATSENLSSRAAAAGTSLDGLSDSLAMEKRNTSKLQCSLTGQVTSFKILTKTQSCQLIAQKEAECKLNCEPYLVKAYAKVNGAI